MTFPDKSEVHVYSYLNTSTGFFDAALKLCQQFPPLNPLKGTLKLRSSFSANSFDFILYKNDVIFHVFICKANDFYSPMT